MLPLGFSGYKSLWMKHLFLFWSLFFQKKTALSLLGLVVYLL